MPLARRLTSHAQASQGSVCYCLRTSVRKGPAHLWDCLESALTSQRQCILLPSPVQCSCASQTVCRPACNVLLLQDSQDPNPLIRALAVRTMGCIRVDKITEYLCDPLQRCLKVQPCSSSLWPHIKRSGARLGHAACLGASWSLVLPCLRQSCSALRWQLALLAFGTKQASQRLM